MKTSYTPETLEIPQLTVIQRHQLPDAYEAEVGLPEVESDEVQKGFESIEHQKRFHVLFYTLAAVTGLVVVQLVWQIAMITAK